MKNVMMIIFVLLLVVAVGLGAWYLLGGGETSSPVTRPPTSQTTTSQDTSSDLDSSDEVDDTAGSDEVYCPEGVICLGSANIPTIPTIVLGQNDVYAAEDPSTEDPTEEPDQQPDQPEVVKGNTPQAVMINNKDFKVWSVSWVTKDATSGYIKYTSNAGETEKSSYDDREQNTSNLIKRYTHHVSITNTDEELQKDDLTFSFKIISDDEEFDNNGADFQYENAPLTTSPSLPNSLAITSDRKGGVNDDYIVIARIADSDGDKSSTVSGVFEGGELDLVIGIARTSNLRTYFPYSQSNLLEARLYGPYGYTGYASGVTLAEIGEEFLSIQSSETGYGGSVFGASGGSDYTIGDVPESPSTPTITTTTTKPTQPDEKLPHTGVEDSWAFRSVFGLVVFLIGTLSVIVYVPWNILNIRRMWERKVEKEMEE